MEVKDIIKEIVVNEENKHVYGISNNRMKLYHVDKELKIKQIMDIKFKRKILLDVLVTPHDFHVDENYIFIFTPFINKHHLFDIKLNLFVFNHEILLQKTGFDIWSYRDARFLVVDYQTIYCADFGAKCFKRLEFSNLYVYQMYPVKEHLNI